MTAEQSAALALCPATVRFGADADAALAALCADTSVRRVLLVHGRHSFAASGAQAWLAPLAAGREIAHFDAVRPNPTVEAVQACAAAIDAFAPDVLLAVGGGSALDTAKAARHVLACGGAATAARDVLAGRAGAPAAYRLAAMRWIAAPTTAGTGSEVTHFAAVYVDGIKHSLADPSMRPEQAWVQPCLLASLPHATTVAAGLDALTQAIESAWSVGSDEASRAQSMAALRLAWPALPAAAAGDAAAQRSMALAATLAGLGIDHAKTTACHALSYTMTARWGVDHGVAVALTLAPMLRLNAATTAENCIDPRGPAHVHRVIDAIVAVIGGPEAWTARLRALGVDPDPAAHGVVGTEALAEV
ncbi:MAG: hypothetical protein RIT45_2154, partial [Pseudomonadota bacterium]